MPNGEAMKSKHAPAHRPREEKERREVIGASVRAITKRQIEAWTQAGRRISGPACNPGRILDQVIAEAKRAGFRPRRDS